MQDTRLESWPQQPNVIATPRRYRSRVKSRGSSAQRLW
jgi:hypothetical protein